MKIVCIQFTPFLDIMEQAAAIDFPIPNEIIEMVTAYLSLEDLHVLVQVGTERLKKCTFRIFLKKLGGKCYFV